MATFVDSSTISVAGSLSAEVYVVDIASLLSLELHIILHKSTQFNPTVRPKLAMSSILIFLVMN